MSAANRLPWEKTVDTPPLRTGEVHIWRINTETPVLPTGWLPGSLSEEERAKAKRFHFEKDRRQFEAARTAQRMILGGYLDMPPAGLRFRYGPQGKPSLDPGSNPGGLSFNLSHSGTLILIAVAWDREIGVDIEIVRQDLDLEGIAQQFFSPREVRALMALDPDRRVGAFFECWTQKEAYIKARGGGLSIPLKKFDVALGPGVPAALLATRDDLEEVKRWSLYRVEAGDDYRAAIAVQGGAQRLLHWDFELIRSPSGIRSICQAF